MNTMMDRLRLYFKVKDGAVDEDGQPDNTVMYIDLGALKEPIPYQQIEEGVSKAGGIKGFFDIIGFKSFYDTERLTLITPEEYEKVFGNDDDE